MKTVPLPINSMAIPMAGEPFPDFAPHRGRTFGPYAQLPAAILVQIRARAGLTGSRWTGRCLIPEQHLAPVLQGTNFELLGEQMFGSSSFCGRRTRRPSHQRPPPRPMYGISPENAPICPFISYSVDPTPTPRDKSGTNAVKQSETQGIPGAVSTRRLSC